MCFDPISLGLLAAGTGASIIGGNATRKAQQEAITRDLTARNAVLASTEGKLAGFQGANSKAIGDNLTSTYGPGAQTASLDSATSNRNNLNNEALIAPDTNVTSSDTPQIIKDSVAAKMLDAFKYATTRAKGLAAAGAYGDVAGGNARAISDTSGTVDMNNNFAHSTAAMLPDQQQFASTEAYQVPSQTGPILSSVGSLMAGLGGSKMVSGLGGKISVPGFNPIAGVTGA